MGTNIIYMIFEKKYKIPLNNIQNQAFEILGILSVGFGGRP